MGLRQHYLIGYDLLNSVIKGSNFSPVYSPHQIQIRSTNENMTLMAAQASLEGILPPGVRPNVTDL